MTLKDDFFKVIEMESEESGFRCKVRMNAEHAIYKAHFPNNPITPGVCIMQMVTEILQERFECRLHQDIIPAMKFKKAMSPDVEPTLTFSKIAKDDNSLSVRVAIEAEGNKYSTMTLQYEVEH